MNFLDIFNLYGLIFTVILVIPHIIFAKTRNYDTKIIKNRGMLYIERGGKYAGAFLMFVNIGVLEEGFTSEYMKYFWLIATSVLCVIYIFLWLLLFKKNTKLIANLITIVTATILILSGLLQVKTLLLTAGIVYLIGEIYICKNIYE